MPKHSSLDEPADLKAEKGSLVWARGVARKIRFEAKKLDSEVDVVQGWIEVAAEHEVWRLLGYVSLDSFLVSEADISQSVIDAICRAKKGTTVKEAIENPLPPADQNEHPRNPAGRKGKESADDVSRLGHGNSADYLLRRMARDAPGVLNAYAEGEYPSVRQAAIAAGIVRVPTPVDIIKREWGKATEEQRREVMEWITQE